MTAAAPRPAAALRRALLAGAALALGVAGIARAEGLDDWAFLLGDWEVVESRFDESGASLGSTAGEASFERVLRGQRIQETLVLGEGDGATAALQTWVYDPRLGEVEIARTDSAHYGFWVIGGTLSAERMELRERHPDPGSKVTRRITYRRDGSDRFTRRLDFSTDGGATWWLRAETAYRRRPAFARIPSAGGAVDPS